MTTNYWAHQDITSKNLQRPVGKVAMLRDWNCNQLTPLTDWSGFYFTSRTYHQRRFIGYFPVQIIYLTLVLVGVCLLNGFEIVCWVTTPLTPPHYREDLPDA